MNEQEHAIVNMLSALHEGGPELVNLAFSSRDHLVSQVELLMAQDTENEVAAVIVGLTLAILQINEIVDKA